MRDRALVIVDVQNDFCPGGALGVAGGDEVVRPLSRLAHAFAGAGLPVVITRDWHPPRTRHFAAFGGAWPPHCVQGTHGAEFHPALSAPAGAVVVSKGTDPQEDGYSAFDARDAEGRPLARLLLEAGVRELYLGGLTTDYCVRYSARDAARLGLRVAVIEDAVRAVDPQEGERALAEIRAAGGRTVTLAEVERELQRSVEESATA